MTGAAATARARVAQLNDAWTRLLDHPDEAVAASLHGDLDAIKAMALVEGWRDIQLLCSVISAGKTASTSSPTASPSPGVPTASSLATSASTARSRKQTSSATAQATPSSSASKRGSVPTRSTTTPRSSPSARRSVEAAAARGEVLRERVLELTAVRLHGRLIHRSGAEDGADAAGLRELPAVAEQVLHAVVAITGGAAARGGACP